MTRTIHSPRWLLTGALAASLLVGCQGSGTRGNYGSSATQFQDVVVPAGMRLRDQLNESYSSEVATWKKAHLIYTGQVRVVDADSYVRLRMPAHGWELAEQTQLEGGGVQLRFERHIYSAIYQISRGDGVTTMVVDYSTDESRR